MKNYLLPLLVSVCALADAIVANAQSTYEPYTFTTLAGAPTIGYADGTGLSALFYYPGNVAVDGAGNVYVADLGNSTIRKMSPAAVVTTLAGSPGVIGSIDGKGSAALFNSPHGVAVDSTGNIYVADTYNHTIRTISPAGVVTTLAGLAGTPGSTDGTGGAARFDYPNGVAVDNQGIVYVADSGNNTIRKVTSSGVVTTLAGLAGNSGSADGTGSAARFLSPAGIALASEGTIYVGDTGNDTVRKITSSGVVTTFAGLAGQAGSVDGTGTAARFDSPAGVAVDGTNNVYVADSSNNTIRKITPAGTVSTLAGLAGVTGFGSDDGTGSAARFDYPTGVATDSAGSIYVADFFNNLIRKVTPAGVVTSLAGGGHNFGSADGTGRTARFNLPEGVAVDGAGDLYAADSYNHTIRKITAAGVVTTFAGLAGESGSADGTGNIARFYLPRGLTVDDTGNLYVADSANCTIRKITPAGVVSTLAGVAGQPGSADGTGSEAQFFLPYGLALDSTGNIYVADANNYTIRKVTPDGVVTTLAGLAGRSGTANGTGSLARFSDPVGVAVDSAGNVYVADDVFDYTIRKITPTGVVTTFAGLTNSSGSADGTGSAARFSGLREMAVDSASNLYVADASTVRKITPARVVTTLAGLGDYSFDYYQGSADGTGSQTRFYAPESVAVDVMGKLYVADTYNNTIRVGVAAVLTAELLNISTRVRVLSGDNVLIGGFIITGKAPKKIILQAIGPSLTTLGISDALADPILELHEPDESVVTNDNWKDSQQAEIEATHIPPTDDHESAIVATLAPGAYTAIVSGKAAGTGIGLVEAYDLDSAADSTLANISTRGFVDTGDNVMIGGIIVGGGTSQVLVRAIGPELTAQGVSGALEDTTLELHDTGGNTIASNDDWKETQQADIEATRIPPTDDRESAVLMTLTPGSYTAIVRGKNNTTGIALVEVYNVTP